MRCHVKKAVLFRCAIFTAELLKETCADVSIETPLQKITNKSFRLRTSNVSDEARVDVATRGVLARGQPVTECCT